MLVLSGMKRLVFKLARSADFTAMNQVLGKAVIDHCPLVNDCVGVRIPQEMFLFFAEVMNGWVNTYFLMFLLA